MDLVAELLAPLDQHQGVRVVALGITGGGKSYALRRLVAAAAPKVDVVYVVDDGPDAHEWGGQRRIDLADCAARPLVARAAGGSNLVVLTGDGLAGRTVDAEAVARDAWGQARAGHTALVVFDELRRAFKSPKRWQEAGGDLPRLFTEGRKYGLSVLAATNFPQEVPREALGQSHLLTFRLDGAEVSYLRDTRLVSPELAAEVAALRSFEFTVRRLGGLTDRTRFRF